MSHLISGIVLAVMIARLSTDAGDFVFNTALAFVFYNAGQAYMRKLKSQDRP